MEFDQYKTISKPSDEALFKDRNSKFFGYAFPIEDEDAAKIYLEEVKKQHYAARHWCYAYKLGKLEAEQTYRANDDGEPSNSAGMPIYGQILSNELTDVLVIVVRYFGGTKLGVGGLINAYRTAAQLSLEKATIVKRTVNQRLSLVFDYMDMNKVMRILKEDSVSIIENNSALKCEIIVSVRLLYIDNLTEKFRELYNVEIKKLES